MTLLSVNVNKFALLRNSRDTNYPELTHMAVRAIEAVKCIRTADTPVALGKIHCTANI